MQHWRMIRNGLSQHFIRCRLQLEKEWLCVVTNYNTLSCHLMLMIIIAIASDFGLIVTFWPLCCKIYLRFWQGITCAYWQQVMRLGFDWDTNNISILLLAKLAKPLLGTARIVINSLHIKGDVCWANIFYSFFLSIFCSFFDLEEESEWTWLL